jgi:hypothetical protein
MRPGSQPTCWRCRTCRPRPRSAPRRSPAPAAGGRPRRQDPRHLQLPPVRHQLQLVHPVPGEQGQQDVDGGPDGCAQVGGAEGEPAEARVGGEGHQGLDVLYAVYQQLEHVAHVPTGGHRDYAQVVLLTHPHLHWAVMTCTAPHRTRNVFSALWKMPRPVGQ